MFQMWVQYELLKETSNDHSTSSCNHPLHNLQFFSLVALSKGDRDLIGLLSNFWVQDISLRITRTLSTLLNTHTKPVLVFVMWKAALYNVQRAMWRELGGTPSAQFPQFEELKPLAWGLWKNLCSFLRYRIHLRHFRLWVGLHGEFSRIKN